MPNNKDGLIFTADLINDLILSSKICDGKPNNEVIEKEQSELENMIDGIPELKKYFDKSLRTKIRMMNQSERTNRKFRKKQKTHYRIRNKDRRKRR